MTGPTPPRRGILLEAYNAVYVEVAKVASSSIKIALANLLQIEVHPSGDPHRTVFPSARLDQLPRPDMFVFGFVRNPWSRLLSCYLDKVGGQPGEFTHNTIRPGVANCLARYDSIVAGMLFDDFVHAVAAIPDSDADEHFRSQHTFFTNGTQPVAANFVGKYETLAADFAAVARQLRLPFSTLPHLQATQPEKPPSNYYTPALQELVAERYRVDIATFDYNSPV